MVPPVWASPRPLILATVRPSAASIGVRTRRGLVAHPAGAVLIYGVAQAAQVQQLAAVGHAQGQIAGLLGAQAPEVHAHQPGAHLVVRHLAARIAADQGVQLGAAVLGAVAFLLDQVGDVQAESLPSDPESSSPGGRRARRVQSDGHPHDAAVNPFLSLLSPGSQARSLSYSYSASSSVCAPEARPTVSFPVAVEAARQRGGSVSPPQRLRIGLPASATLGQCSRRIVQGES